MSLLYKVIIIANQLAADRRRRRQSWKRHFANGGQW